MNKNVETIENLINKAIPLFEKEIYKHYKRLYPELKKKFILRVTKDKPQAGFENMWAYTLTDLKPPVIVIQTRVAAVSLFNFLVDNVIEIIKHEITHALGANEKQAREFEHRSKFFKK